MHQGADDHHHPPPTTLRVIMSGQKPSSLHLRPAVLLLAIFLLVVLPFLGVLRETAVPRLAVPFRSCFEKRPGSRSRYRHHTHVSVHLWPDYVPVSCTLDLFARGILGPRIRHSRDRDSPLLVRDILPIVRKAPCVLAARFSPLNEIATLPAARDAVYCHDCSDVPSSRAANSARPVLKHHTHTPARQKSRELD